MGGKRWNHEMINRRKKRYVKLDDEQEWLGRDRAAKWLAKAEPRHAAPKSRPFYASNRRPENQ